MVCQVGRGVKLLGTQSLSELTVVPPATPKLEEVIMLLYMALRNKTTTDSLFMKIHNDAGSPIIRGPLSDDGQTFVRDKLVNPIP